MYNVRTLAKRYSKALFELSLEEGALSKTASELKMIADAALSVPYFFKALSDNRVPIHSRIDAWSSISKLLGTTKPVSDIVKLLISRNKIFIFSELAPDFFRRMENYEHMADVTLSTIDDTQSKYLQQRIADIFTTDLKISPIYKTRIDPSLIGGFTLRVGDMFFDASVRGKVEKIKNMLERD